MQQVGTVSVAQQKAELFGSPSGAPSEGSASESSAPESLQGQELSKGAAAEGQQKKAQ